MADAEWKPGSGRLGALAPLLGEWVAEAEGPMGRVHCTRRFTPALGGAYVQLVARWTFLEPGEARVEPASGAVGYEEHAFFGAMEGGGIDYWSFTSDGQRSTGELADLAELHPRAIGFVARMPAGTARQAYWPAEDGGVAWVVEAKTPRGWERMVEHRYTRAAPAPGPAGQAPR
jgi:hypothetical protein